MSVSAAVIAAQPSTEMLDYLHRRRSVSVSKLRDPGPSAEQVDAILRAAARVPDHGKLAPWYFIVFEGDARRDAGELVRAAYAADHPEAEPAKLDLEAERFLRAPVCIAVVSRIRDGKFPIWEQFLSAGAACQNLCLAANALGFGTHWVTEWLTYSAGFKAALGLDARDNIAGFVYIGTPDSQPEERDRPNLPAITTRWTRGATLNKGDATGQPGAGLPEAGFTTP